MCMCVHVYFVKRAFGHEPPTHKHAQVATKQHLKQTLFFCLYVNVCLGAYAWIRIRRVAKSELTRLLILGYIVK